jgi:hypothetical protein
MAAMSQRAVKSEMKKVTWGNYIKVDVLMAHGWDGFDGFERISSFATWFLVKIFARLCSGKERMV